MTMRSMLSLVSTGWPGSCCISPSLRIMGGAPMDMCKSEPLLSTSLFNKRSTSAVAAPLTGMLGRLCAAEERLGLGIVFGRSMFASMMFVALGALMPYAAAGAGGRCAALAPLLSHKSRKK